MSVDRVTLRSGRRLFSLGPDVMMYLFSIRSEDVPQCIPVAPVLHMVAYGRISLDYYDVMMLCSAYGQ